jgi:hypothetical protein
MLRKNATWLLVEAAGIAPANQKTQWQYLQELTEIQNSLAANTQFLDGTLNFTHAIPEFDLLYLITRWGSLPESVRQTIVQLIRSFEMSHTWYKVSVKS